MTGKKTNTVDRKSGRKGASTGFTSTTSSRSHQRSDNGAVRSERSTHLQEDMHSLSSEQKNTMARIKRLDEKIERKRKARSSSNTGHSHEQNLQDALDDLMKSVGNDKMLWSNTMITYHNRLTWDTVTNHPFTHRCHFGCHYHWNLVLN